MYPSTTGSGGGVPPAEYVVAALNVATLAPITAALASVNVKIIGSFILFTEPSTYILG